MIDKYEVIELKIFQLIDSQEKWWTIDEISKKILLSKGSIQKYVDLLKIRTNAFSKEIIYLEKSPSKGIFLHRSPTFDPQIIYIQIFKEQLSFSIFNSFFTHKGVPVLQMAMDNFSSVASIRRKYQILNQRFNHYNLHLSITKDHIEGSERQLRWFYSKFYWNVFKGREWPFPALPKNIAERMLEGLQNFFHTEFLPEVKVETLYWIAVNWTRYSKGHKVLSDIEIKNYCLNNELYYKFLKFSTQDSYKKYFKNEKSGNDNDEVQYFFFLISALPLLEKNIDFCNQNYSAHQHANTLIYRVTKEWIHLFKGTFGYSLSNKERNNLERVLIRVHSYSYLFIVKPHLMLENYEQKDTKYYPKFQKTLELFFEQLQVKYPYITENKTYLLEHYTTLILSIINLNKFEKTIRICLSFSKGVLYELIAKERIMSRFGMKYNIHFVPNDVDSELLLTDLPHFISRKSKHSLTVTSKLTERDFNHIQSILLTFL